jgi:hypothetical protein
MSSISPKFPIPEASGKNLRIVAFVVAMFLSFCTFWLFLYKLCSGDDILGSGFNLGFAVAALICWWFALHGAHQRSRVRMMYILVGALIVGGIGYTAGYFGPLTFTPKANQGPLLGIFITGPFGFAVGAIIGAVVGYIRTRKIPN